MPHSHRGFSLIEMLVVIAIIGILATVATVAVVPSLARARDARRQSDLAQIGRLLAGGGCFQPDAGPGDYDLAQLFGEVKAKFSQVAQFVSRAPRDPRGGSDTTTKYRYLLSADGSKCAVYANLENANSETTLKSISAPTPGGGTGIFEAPAVGPNGSKKFFQVSN